MPFSNTAIEGLLKRHGLAVTEDGIMLLRGDLEIAEESRASTIPLKAEPARRLVAAIDTVMEIAEAHELVSNDARNLLVRLRERARLELVMVSGGPKPLAWLWPCCLNFLGTWRSQTNAPDGVYHRDEPSPALRFLVDCCALIDPDVSASKIRRAKSAFEHRPSDEEAAAAYEQKSEIAENPDDLDL